MSDKHLSRSSHRVANDVWWYEIPSGLHLFVRHNIGDIRDYTIPWRAMSKTQEAIKRLMLIIVLREQEGHSYTGEIEEILALLESEPELKAGDKIKFVQTLECGPTEEHPAQVYAEKGETGEIVEVGGCIEGYWVKTDSWPHKFGCKRKEFELIESEPEPGELVLSDEFVEALINDINQSSKLEKLSNKALVELLTNRVWGKLQLMTFESNLIEAVINRIDRLEAELKSIKQTICEAHYPYPKMSPHDDLCPYCLLVKQDEEMKQLKAELSVTRMELEAAEKEIEELRKYAFHTPNCIWHNSIENCDCGYVDIEQALKGVKDGE